MNAAMKNASKINTFISFIALAVLISWPSLIMISCGPTSSDSGRAQGPVINGLSGGQIGPGDTLSVFGSRFAADLASNKIVFNGAPAVAAPFSGSSTKLDCVVPETAFTGMIWVESGGVKSNQVSIIINRVVAIDSASVYYAPPGAQIVIYGRRFTPETSSNLVVFNNAFARAVPFSASSTQLQVVVPANAVSGPMWVEVYGSKSDSLIMEIQRNVGDVWLMDASRAGFSFKVKSTTGNEKYLLVPHFPLATSASFSYEVSPADASTYPAPPGVSGRTGTPLGLQQKFEQQTRSEAIQFLMTKPQAVPRRIGIGPPLAQPPDPADFFVIHSSLPGASLDPANFTRVTAQLRYSGSRSYIYSDVNMPQGRFTQADYDSFGVDFDTGIFQTDSTYFGAVTDINHDNHVTILFTPVVNDLTPPGSAQQNGFIAGFFLLNDLTPSIMPVGTTNSMEIFYVVVPDSTGQHGNVFPKSLVKRVAPSVLAHELEHMISFGYRYFVYGRNYLMETWLEEGMAHMAEDINGLDGDNIGRANLFLAPDPGAVSLMDNDTLAQRGGIYLFLRYVADKFGEDKLKMIIQNSHAGTKAVEFATGANFFSIFSDWLGALYLSGRGIATDSKYEYDSINLQGQDFAPLGTVSRSVSQGAFAGTVKGSAGDFFIITNPTPPGIEFSAGSLSPTTLLRITAVRVQ